MDDIHRARLQRDLAGTAIGQRPQLKFKAMLGIKAKPLDGLDFPLHGTAFLHANGQAWQRDRLGPSGGTQQQQAKGEKTGQSTHGSLHRAESAAITGPAGARPKRVGYSKKNPGHATGLSRKMPAVRQSRRKFPAQGLRRGGGTAGAR
jgi:hypothetical protein